MTPDEEENAALRERVRLLEGAITSFVRSLQALSSDLIAVSGSNLDGPTICSYADEIEGACMVLENVLGKEEK